MNAIATIDNNDKNDAYTRILRFYMQADIVLTAAEEEILKRWNFCDKLLRQRKYRTEEVIEKIMELFGVSKYTAQNDINQAYALFGQTRTVSKQYLLIHHAEEIALQIEQIKTDKSLYYLLPKLNDSYTKAIAALPDEISKKELPTPTVIIGVIQGQSATPTMTFEEAQAKLKQRRQKIKPDFTDFEDVPK